MNNVMELGHVASCDNNIFLILDLAVGVAENAAHLDTREFSAPALLVPTSLAEPYFDSLTRVSCQSVSYAHCHHVFPLHFYALK